MIIALIIINRNTVKEEGFGKGNVCLFFYLFDNSPKGEWADPGGTAIPGQPVGKSEQAPVSSPKFKNQFNIVDLQWRSYQILS